MWRFTRAPQSVPGPRSRRSRRRAARRSLPSRTFATAPPSRRCARLPQTGLGGLDILVNNAGVFVRKDVAAMDLASWDSMIETNLTAPYLATQAALPAIRASGAGASVIFVSSIAAGAYSAGWGTYAMTKNGLVAFMRCLADELGGAGVRVNAICPGWVETRMAQNAHRGLAADLGIDYETHYAQNMRANMLGALVTTDSIADMAVFLASERGRHITAQELTVCGGCLPGSSAEPPKVEAAE